MSDVRLTDRQREIAALVAEGLTNGEIATRLVLTPGTVANHLALIMRAIGARNRVQVAVWSVRQEPNEPTATGNAAG
jgi:DNA-binding NarL/FixJ family response regulator